MNIVLCGILRINDQLHIVFVHEVLKLFFHEPYYNIYLMNTHCLKLMDLSFNQLFPIDLKKCFGCLMVDWHHPHAKSCSKDNSILGLSFIHQLFGLGRCLHLVDISILFQ